MIITPPKTTGFTQYAYIDMSLSGQSPDISFNYTTGVIGGHQSLLIVSSSGTGRRPSILQFLGGTNYSWSGYSASGLSSTGFNRLFGDTVWMVQGDATSNWGKFNFGVDPLTGIINSIIRTPVSTLAACNAGSASIFLAPFIDVNGNVIVAMQGIACLNNNGVFPGPLNRSNDVYNMSFRYGIRDNSGSNGLSQVQIAKDKVAVLSSSGVVSVYSVAQYANNNGGCAGNSIGATYTFLYSFRLSDICGTSVTVSSTTSLNSGDVDGSLTACCYQSSNPNAFFAIYVNYPYAYSLRWNSSPGAPGGIVFMDDGYLINARSQSPNLRLIRSTDKINFGLSINLATKPKDPVPINTINILSTRFSK